MDSKYVTGDKDGMNILFGKFLNIYRTRILKIEISEVSKKFKLNDSYLRLVESGTNRLHTRHAFILASYLKCDVITLLFFSSFMTLTHLNREDIIETKIFETVFSDIKKYNIWVGREEYKKIQKEAEKDAEKMLCLLNTSLSLLNDKDAQFAINFLKQTQELISKKP